jgi:uncharacterized membrane protein YhaH (DUF805 family)
MRHSHIVKQREGDNLMGNLLFSPSGRIGPGQFMKGATILVIVGFILAALPAISPALTMVGIIGIVTYWCWIVLWVKRYHDGGKSGWMCLIPIILYMIIGTILSVVLAGMFVDVEAMQEMAEASEAGDFGALMGMMGAGVTKTGTLIMAAAAAVVSYLIAFLFNKMIKHDAHDNQFGPEAGTS